MTGLRSLWGLFGFPKRKAMNYARKEISASYSFGVMRIAYFKLNKHTSSFISDK